MHISLHCCGSIYPIIGDLIESGYDILNPIQKECDNMDPVQIKKEFGKNMTIWGGGISTQTTLTHGSIDDIVNEVKEMIKVYAPGGGFVFSQIHNIQAGISPEKILAVFDTALKYGNKDFYRG
jgi:uroporphyrinogen decarboxylase